MGAGLGINVGAEMGARLGAIESALSDANQVGVARLKLGWRRYHNIQGSITGIGSQTAAATLAGPEAGRLWHVHRVTLGGAQIGQAVGTAGTVIVGKGTGIQTTAQGSGQLIANASTQQFIEVERTTSCPVQLTWGRAQFVLVYPMNLIVLWASGTDKVALTIDGDAYEYLAETDQPI